MQVQFPDKNAQIDDKIDIYECTCCAKKSYHVVLFYRKYVEKMLNIPKESANRWKMHGKTITLEIKYMSLQKYRIGRCFRT